MLVTALALGLGPTKAGGFGFTGGPGLCGGVLGGRSGLGSRGFGFTGRPGLCGRVLGGGSGLGSRGFGFTGGPGLCGGVLAGRSGLCGLWFCRWRSRSGLGGLVDVLGLCLPPGEGGRCGLCII